MTRQPYISALGYPRLTPLYDTVVRLTIRDHVFKQQLVDQARLEAGQHVLDLACGTGTLTVLLKRSAPNASVVGLDGDPAILELARANAREAGLDIQLDAGLSDELPYRDAAFDRVVTSLFFHHLTRSGKLRTLAEVVRVLKPGGEVHVADWGEPANHRTRFGSLFVRLLDGAETTGDNFSGRLPELIRSSGFPLVEQTALYNTAFGTIRLYRAVKPSKARIEGHDDQKYD